MTVLPLCRIYLGGKVCVSVGDVARIPAVGSVPHDGGRRAETHAAAARRQSASAAQSFLNHLRERQVFSFLI